MEGTGYFLAAAGILFLGSFVQAACGFGFAVVVMGVLSWILPSYGEAAGLANGLMLLVSLWFSLRLRGSIRWKAILWPFIGYVPVSFVMVRIIAADPSGLMEKLLGGALILLGVYMIFFQGRISVPMTPVGGLLTGMASGVLGGLFCMAGVPMALYMLSIGEKEEYLATIQTFFVLVAGYSLVLHSVSGFMTAQVLELGACCLPAVAVATWLGKRIFDRIDQEMLKKGIYGFMLLSGCSLLLF